MAAIMTEVKFIATARGGRKLSHQGYLYRVNRRKGEKCWWKCVNTNCTTNVTTLNDMMITHDANHNHPPDFADCRVQAVMADIRKRARDEITPMPTIYVEEISKLRSDGTDAISDDTARHFPTFTSVKTSLYNQRKKTFHLFHSPETISTSSDAGGRRRTMKILCW